MLRHDKLGSILRREREREVQRDLLVRGARARQGAGLEDAGVETVRLHLLGHGVPDIARRIRRHPTGIAAHLRTFDAVLVLHLYRLPPDVTATVLGCRRRLIDRYHAIIRSHLHDPDVVARYLTGRGIDVPDLDASPEPGSQASAAVAAGPARNGRSGSTESLYGSWC